ncbi:MAG: hypothetical protein Q9192_006642 [Flavoplaca navasiana]
MSTNISTVPNEILRKILEYVMQRDAPVQASVLAHLARLSCPDTYPSLSTVNATSKLIPSEPCTERFCKWFTKVQKQSRCLCNLKPLPKHQAEHLKDWVLANSVCRRFREWAKEAFFTAKVFVITHKDIDRLRSNPTTASVLNRSKEIIVALPNCTAPSPWLTLSRYQQFDNLRVLAVWPGKGSRDIEFHMEAEQLSQNPAPEIFLKVLRDIDLGRADLRIDMIRSKDKKERLSQAALLEHHIFPSLHWVGRQKNKKLQEDEDGPDVTP